MRRRPSASLPGRSEDRRFRAQSDGAAAQLLDLDSWLKFTDLLLRPVGTAVSARQRQGRRLLGFAASPIACQVLRSMSRTTLTSSPNIFWLKAMAAFARPNRTRIATAAGHCFLGIVMLSPFLEGALQSPTGSRSTPRCNCVACGGTRRRKAYATQRLRPPSASHDDYLCRLPAPLQGEAARASLPRRGDTGCSRVVTRRAASCATSM